MVFWVVAPCSHVVVAFPRNMLPPSSGSTTIENCMEKVTSTFRTIYSTSGKIMHRINL
jgi:hypothetical protein